MRKKCIQCGNEFTLADSEIEFYKNKDLEIPKRCKACRESNKKGAKQKKLKDGFRKHPLLMTLAIILLSFLCLSNAYFFQTKRNPSFHSAAV